LLKNAIFKVFKINLQSSVTVFGLALTIIGADIMPTTSWCNWTTWKNHVLWDKNTFCQCSLLNPMRSLSTEANHLDFTKPSSCVLLWCNYLL